MLSPFWTPRKGQWVLCGLGLPYSHLTAAGQAVGIFQPAEALVNTNGTPMLDEAGKQMWNPPHIVPVDKNGHNVMVERHNYADLKGYSVLVPGKGVCHIGIGAEGETVDKFFADNRKGELKLVLGVEEAKLVGPLLERSDWPPGRMPPEGWKPKELRTPADAAT